MPKHCESRKLYQLAMSLLARREHSRYELMTKLRRHCSNHAVIEEVLDKLEKERALSEQRFIEAYIYSKKVRGYGPKSIYQGLVSKGVNRELIEELLERETDWKDFAQKIYKKKYGDTVPKDYAEVVKRKNYLLQRGYLLQHF